MKIDWEKVKKACAVAEISEEAGEALLFAAMSNSGSGVIALETAVIYGRNGYSDEYDPRDLDCRNNDGSNVWLQVHSDPAKQYRVKRVELLQEDESCNVYFICTNADGAMVPVMGARLGSPYSGSDSGFRSTWKAPASPDSIFMGPDSKFWGSDLGPLAGFLVDQTGQIISDVVGSMGLREGKHVSYRLYFEER